MRIIAGNHRGRKLYSPLGEHIRPTEDRIKESVFNILGMILPGAEVLDLCAGTGSMGLEFLSRGAGHVTFVDEDRAALVCIRKNIGLLHAEAQTTIMPVNADKALKRLAGEERIFDYIYLDPPYEKHHLYDKLMRRVEELNLLRQGGLFLVETNADYPLTERLSTAWQVDKNRQYRDTVIYFITHKE